MPDRRFTPFAVLLALAFAALAQDNVPIIFLPPPMEGTIALGIFDGTGKLVRVLHREAVVDDFKQGENGLIARWDGRDDTGQPVPRGKYGVHGWATGNLGVEGVAFHGNDWIKEESPRFTRVISVNGVGRDEVQVKMRTSDGKEETLGWKLARPGDAPQPNDVTAAIEDEKLIIRRAGESTPVILGDGESPVACVSGYGGRIWAIIETPEGREVRAYSSEGEFLRHLPYQKGEPQPVQIAASQWSEMIFLLDENNTGQRLRSLALGTSDQQSATSAGSPAKSAWRVTYLKRIVKSDTFEAIAADLGRAKPPKAEPVVKIPVRANPLLGDAKAEAALKVEVDADGVILKTEDGLPLTRLTVALKLKWAALVKEGASLTLFQGDGCVVEEFKIAHPENLMSFDAGDIVLKPPGTKHSTSAVAPKRSKAKRIGDDL